MTTRRVVVRVANCEGVSERRPQDEARLALTKPGGYGLPDVVLFSEVSWLDVAAMAGKDWHVVQFGAPGTAEAGVAIASRDRIGARDLRIGSRATREGGGIRARGLLTGHTFGADFTAGHAPPERAPVARAQYLARARARPGVVGGDFNVRPVPLRQMVTRTYRAPEGSVLGLIVPRRYKASAAIEVDIDSDHPAVDVPLWIPNRKRKP